MKTKQHFDVIIIGGSYSGLSAGMALGRSLRSVLIIDSGKPCNIKASYAHNFITQDGQSPKKILAKTLLQIEKYKTVKFHSGLATSGSKIKSGFQIKTQEGQVFTSKKLIFATGIKDIMPNIDGFSQCWGISVVYCPYCHGYETRNELTGVLGNGDYGFDFSKLIRNWTSKLTLFTNGKSMLTDAQAEHLRKRNVKIVEKEIEWFEHKNGRVENIIFKDNSRKAVKLLYTHVPVMQNSDIPAQLGCELTEYGFIKIDPFQNATVKGIMACGDCSTFIRAISNAVATGTLAGGVINKEITDEEF